MVAIVAAAIVGVLGLGAELWHGRRIRRLAPLAFGPGGRPAFWATTAPYLRVASLAAMAWGLATLILIEPKAHQAKSVAADRFKHVLLILDVSPSMLLDDAGPESKLSRKKRASEVMESFFKRVPIEQYRISVVAVYNGAKPVVIDTKDVEVVRNILDDLPMHYAFDSGETDLFSGLKLAAQLARPWRPKSTTVLLVSDGDTVPATGMPKMPASVSHVVVVGVGDPHAGKFINGRQSRQDVSTLRQIAARLRGTYHNGNQKHLSTKLLGKLTAAGKSPVEELTRREYALIAIAAGGAIYAFLPLLLHYLGTSWRPGVVYTNRKRERGMVIVRNTSGAR